MARRFVGSSTQYLKNDAWSLVTTPPLTLACWFRTSVNGNARLMHISNRSGVGQHGLQVTTGQKVVCSTTPNAAGAASVVSTAAYSSEIWSHAVGVIRATNSRSVWLNGVGRVDSAASAANPTINSVSVGASYLSSILTPFTGLIAFPAVWNAALTDGEVLMLAQGSLPWQVRPENLVACWLGDANPTVGIAADINPLRGNRYPLTPVGSLNGILGPVAAASRPPVREWRPTWQTYVEPSAPPAGNRRRRSIIMGGG